MPFEFDIHLEFNLIWNRGYGTTTMAQAFNNWMKNRAHPDYTDTLNTLTDLRDLADTTIDYKSLNTVRPTVESRLVELDRPLKSCLYVPTDLSYGMGSIYVRMVEGTPNLDARLFRDLTEALDFLEVPEDRHQMFIDGKPHQG